MPRLSIKERDESGRLIAAYGVDAEKPEEHVEAVRVVRRRTEWRQTLSNVFLPAGYPAGVSPDYLQYQIYNALQAYCSSLAGLIASRAVLEGHGVGRADASATNAILLNIAQDVFSRVATIAAAYWLGTSLYPEAKTYRLLADVFNDISIVLDTLSPHLNFLTVVVQYPFVRFGHGSALRITFLCLSGVFRALCGVVAGGSKAALTMHFASSGRVPGDVGDLNAKDGSKETVLAMLGMLSGTVVMRYVHGTVSTYLVLFVLLFCHLLCNYLAVRAVVLCTLNRQRSNIVWMAYRSQFRDHTGGLQPRVPTPEAVAKHERIFANPSALRNTYTSARPLLAICNIGSPFSAISTSDGSPTPLGPLTPSQIHTVLGLFSDKRYILWLDPLPYRSLHLHICLKEGHTPADQLEAWVHAQEVAVLLNGRSPTSFGIAQAAIQTSSARLLDTFPPFADALQAAGWKLEEGGLLSGSPRTISIEYGDDAVNEVPTQDEDKKNV